MNLQRIQAFNTTPTLTHRINFQSSPHISKIPDFEMKIQLQIRLFDFLLLYLFNLIFYFKLVIDWPFRNSLSADLISANHWTNKPRKGDTTYYQGAQKFRFQNEWKKKSTTGLIGTWKIIPKLINHQNILVCLYQRDTRDREKVI